MNEAETCRKYVVPLLQAAGWDSEPHSIAEQRAFTDGRIVPHGRFITGATVGRVDVFREDLEPGFVSQHVAICRLPADQVDPDYVQWELRSPQGQAQLFGQRYGQSKPGLNLSNIRALRLPFPPLPEQRRIVADLNALQAEMDALKRLQAQTAAELDALLPSILDRAFRGEL